MYNLIRQKQNIVTFKLSDQDVIIKNKKKELYINDKLIYEDTDDFFISENNEFILYNFGGGCVTLKKDFTYLQNVTRYFLNVMSNCENFTFQTDIELNTFLYANNNKLDNELRLISNYNWEFLFCNCNSLYLYDKIIIKSISLLTSKFEWLTDLEAHGEIRKIIGVFDNILWLTMYRAGSSKDKEVLVAINVHNGKLLYMLPEELPISDVHVKLIEDKKTIVSIKSGISTGFIDSYFVEIDALTGKVSRNQTIKAFEKENLKIGLWQFQEDKIYFTANKDFLNATHIGVLDYTTLDLLWFEEVKDRKAGLKEIQVSLDKIYVLDQGQQLHIYEK